MKRLASPQKVGSDTGRNLLSSRGDKTVPRRIQVSLCLFLVIGNLLSISAFSPRPRIRHGLPQQRHGVSTSQQFSKLRLASSSADTDRPSSSFASLEDLRQNARIILVDDEESIRSAVSQLFESRGYPHVTTCEDGQQVLDLLQSDSTLPDCIVSDIRMPQMDGLELLERIRKDELLAKIPVILLTAKGLTQDRIAGYDSGADAYLAKPFQPDELLAIVETVIQRNAVWTNGISVEEPSSQEQASPTVKVEDLQEDLATIKDLLLNQGGAGIGNGFVEKDTNVFFSKEEQTILELLADGYMTKEIASTTHMSTRRIEQLLTQMFRKVNVKNRTELIKWAVSKGHVD